MKAKYVAMSIIIAVCVELSLLGVIAYYTPWILEGRVTAAWSNERTGYWIVLDDKTMLRTTEDVFAKIFHIKTITMGMWIGWDSCIFTVVGHQIFGTYPIVIDVAFTKHTTTLEERVQNLEKALLYNNTFAFGTVEENEKVYEGLYGFKSNQRNVTEYWYIIRLIDGTKAFYAERLNGLGRSPTFQIGEFVWLTDIDKDFSDYYHKAGHVDD